ncbi:F0F1 ATP synthase subunit delta [uncultured Nitrosomonas sp.]|uniref:F0F1 ATP synthase subunit delta n=1 Tax=uncultured Nitrosomonas sp. TaxID=156424 RepID=UPI0026175F95|nr:F0F1 ATP synthase subunit delta [uncultured Nitrosomonas sp.]
MAEAITIARPYAEALFKLAKGNGSLFSWSEMLQVMSAITRENQVRELINNPQISSQKMCEIILSISGKKVNEIGERFLTLVTENQRLEILPQICELFEQLKAQHEGVLEAEVVSAFPLESGQQEKLVSILESKFKRKVKVGVSVNNELIGGVRIKIGDQVIDSSVHGKLEAMATALKS